MITALLALITQQHQSAEVNVSYVIAINVWMIVCITFVFFGLIEYAIAIAYDQSTFHFNEKNIDNNIKKENPENIEVNKTLIFQIKSIKILIYLIYN